MIPELLRTIWDWLPAFLAIADAGSVVGAARRLHLTPQAVSRTLGLLEEAVGEDLFNRVGRSLVLNRRGAALQEAVRRATHSIERGLAEALEDRFLGPVRVASLGVLTDSFVVPALIDLKREQPDLVPEHHNLRTAEAYDRLRRGELDVAFSYERLTGEELVVERLGEIGASVYCGRGHPLFDARRVTRQAILSHPFSVPQIGDTGAVMDGWPAELPRTIGMRITMLRSNALVCQSGVLLTVLPDVIAAEALAAGALRRLRAVRLPPIEVFAARHASTMDRAATAQVVAGVSARLDDPRACAR